MMVVFQLHRWLIYIFLAILLTWNLTSHCVANETAAREILNQSTIRFSPKITDNQIVGVIDELLSVPFARLSIDMNSGCKMQGIPSSFKRPAYEHSDSRSCISFLKQKKAISYKIWSSLGLSQLYVAGLRPVIVPLADQSRELTSEKDCLGIAGSLSNNVSRLYSSFIIETSLNKFTLEFYGIRKGRKRLIYRAAVGLGAREYPTPRGKYFITKIFDDDPWWFPPDKPWAWGYVPNRTVYGGHMMPLMLKRPTKKINSIDFDLGLIAPKMKMVDSGGYRIHGTDSPWSIGENQSHGCVRMKNETIKRLIDSLRLYVGVTGTGKSINGKYSRLSRPVRVVLH